MMPVSAARTSAPQTPLPVSSGSSTSNGTSTNQSRAEDDELGDEQRAEVPVAGKDREG